MTSLVRLRAVRKALHLLHAIAQRESTFAEYAGHLLLAFRQIGTTSRSAAIRRPALEMGRECAARWKERWPETRRQLSGNNVLDQVIASYAAQRLGIVAEDIRADVRRVVAACTTRELLFFDPSIEEPPDDVPEDCECGCTNARGRRRCGTCGQHLSARSRWSLWYYALTSTYFCERNDVPLRVRLVDVVHQLARLRPYPTPDAPDYYEGIYAITHLVYTLNGYGCSRLSRRLLREEYRFLKVAMRWALAQKEADTIGEIIDSLLALGLDESDELLVAGRAFLLETQCDDGGWGDEGGDEYAYFHTVWTAIDGLRDYSWRGTMTIDRTLWRALALP